MTALRSVPFYIPPPLDEDELSWVKTSIDAVLRTGLITNGAYVGMLESKIKETHKVDHVIACSSATQGLHLVLEALKPETLMIQSFTWTSIKYILPLRPITYCDVDRETWLMNPRVRTYWDFLPRAIIYTHTFGNTGIATTETEDEKIIYDGAYSLGADLPDIGDATVMSTTATKTVTSCEGGLILTNDTKFADELRNLRNKCSRMSELNAIVGLAYFDQLKTTLDRKKEIFEFYNANLPFVHQKPSRWGTTCGYYSCLVPNRDELLKKLEGKVETRIRYEPLRGGLQVTDEIFKQVLTLPCYPSLDEKAVVKEILQAIG